MDTVCIPNEFFFNNFSITAKITNDKVRVCLSIKHDKRLPKDKTFRSWLLKVYSTEELRNKGMSYNRGAFGLWLNENNHVPINNLILLAKAYMESDISKLPDSKNSQKENGRSEID
jgi:hypothetical protein